MAGEDPAHLAHLRTLQCAACARSGEIEAHHTTHGHGHGMSRKAHDHAAFPLCPSCHAEFHRATGRFGLMKRAHRNVWQERSTWSST